MKKTLLTAVAVLASASFSIDAQETVKTLYSGDAVDVTWDNTLKVDASFFAEDVSAGNYILINLENATDVLEIKSSGTWLPGSRLTNIEGAQEYKAYITADMLAALKADGLEIAGQEFTVTSVAVMNDGFVMPEGAIWGGYFWVDNWNTLELFKTAFDNYGNQRYLNIYLSSDNGGNTGYYVKVLTGWDNPDAVWADNDQIRHSAVCASVDLQGIDVKDALASVNTLMIQSNPEGGNPYNLTAITLSDAPVASRIETVVSGNELKTAPSTLYNMQGIVVAEDVLPADISSISLPAGVYILDGRKYVIR